MIGRSLLCSARLRSPSRLLDLSSRADQGGPGWAAPCAEAADNPRWARTDPYTAVCGVNPLVETGRTEPQQFPQTSWIARARGLPDTTPLACAVSTERTQSNHLQHGSSCFCELVLGGAGIRAGNRVSDPQPHPDAWQGPPDPRIPRWRAVCVWNRLHGHPAVGGCECSEAGTQHVARAPRVIQPAAPDSRSRRIRPRRTCTASTRPQCSALRFHRTARSWRPRTSR